MYIDKTLRDHSASRKCGSRTFENLLLSVCTFTFLPEELLLDKTIRERTNSAVIPHLPYDEIKREEGGEEQSPFSTPSSLLLSLPLCLHLSLPSPPPSSLFHSLPATAHFSSPHHNLTLPVRAARHGAVLYFFAHFSQRLVPSHTRRSIPCSCAERCGRRRC